MDQRINRLSPRQQASGSPFLQTSIYDWSKRYGLQKRTSSVLTGTAYEVDSTEILKSHLDAIRDANQDLSISGFFELERLWLNDGHGEPVFMVGDCLEKITGRDYSLAANLSGTSIYPEIIQIVYDFEKQHTKLITRDLRFAEVPIT
jgi:hypothetical protein